MFQNVRRFFSTFGLILVIALFGFVSYRLVNTRLESENSDALYGGELEVGYPSAGFLIGKTSKGGTSTCGFAAISSNMGITAGHCIDDIVSIRVGKGNFSQVDADTLPVIRAFQKDAWVTSHIRSQDFAVIHYDGAGFFTSFAEVASPVEGCHAKVVAYGRTEDPAESILKPRKSATVCVSDINSTTFEIIGESSGICFGDSGSPIYAAGTNQIIGIVVSIIKPEGLESSAEACAIGNRATVVRVDSNRNFMNDNAPTQGEVIGDIPVADIVEVEVVERTFWESIGLEEIENLSTREKEIFLVNTLLVGAVVGVLSLVLYVVWPYRRLESDNYYH